MSDCAIQFSAPEMVGAPRSEASLRTHAPARENYLVEAGMKYERTISEAWLELLGPGGGLHRLTAELGYVGRVPVELQFRRNNELSLDAGKTSALRLRLVYGNEDIVGLCCSLARGYAGVAAEHQLTADAVIPLEAAPELVGRWVTYRGALSSSHFDAEGASLYQAVGDVFGRRYDPKIAPFCVIDRKVVLARDPEDGPYVDGLREQYRQLGEAIHEELGDVSSKLKDKINYEVDALAVGEEGDLWLVVLKHKHPWDIYRAPLQVAQYLELFRGCDQRNLHTQVNALISQKMKIGLLPARAPLLREGFALRCCVMVGVVNEKSSCWRTMSEVSRVLNEQKKASSNDWKSTP